MNNAIQGKSRSAAVVDFFMIFPDMFLYFKMVDSILANIAARQCKYASAARFATGVMRVMDAGVGRRKMWGG